ncbi:MAG: hypothetical protein QXX98_04030 [Thermoplasmata archaeon]
MIGFNKNIENKIIAKINIFDRTLINEATDSTKKREPNTNIIAIKIASIFIIISPDLN